MTWRIGHQLINFFFVVFCVVSAGTARADISKEMDSMFSDMQNVTSPKAMMGQRRGMISGGRVSTRTRNAEIDPVTIRPPYIRAGCGGLDLFGGSFSFISADQFVHSLRNIAQMAPGYFFKVAMENMCPMCSSVMSNMRNLMDKINKFSSDSCTALKEIDQQAEKMTGYSIKSSAEWAATKINSGGSSLAKTMFDIEGENKSPSEEASEDPDKVDDMEEKGEWGNIVWQHLKDQDVKTWWDSNDYKMVEAVMSVTGTAIIKKPDPDDADKSASDQQVPPDVQMKESLLDIKDLMEGPGDADEQGGSDQNKVDIWRCKDNHSDCLDLQREEVTIESFNKRVRESVNEVITKYVTNQSFDPDDKAFMQTAPAAIGGMLRNLARMSPGTAMIFANRASPAIAQMMASNLLLNMMKTARVAVIHADADNVSKLIDQFDDKRDELREQQKSIQGTLRQLSGLIGAYNDINQAIKKQRMGITELQNAIDGAGE